jgi:hypothetical protein
VAGIFLEVASDPKRRVFVDLLTKTQALVQGARGFNFSLDGKVTLRLVPQLDLDLVPSVNVSWGEPRYATTGVLPGELIFGDLQALAVGATVRATWTFTPRLTLQLYAQLFLAEKHYANLYAFYGPTTGPRPLVHLGDLQRSFEGAPSTNPDVQEGVVNVNLVLRWEYRLGSTLFLVYTRAQVPNVVLGAGQPATLDLGAIRKGPAADVFLIKATYWWG